MSEKNSSVWKLPQNDFLDCFGCSQKNLLGLKLQFWYTADSCLSYYTIPSQFCGFSGIAHGGIIATILDEVAAWTIITQLLKVGITLNSSIEYLKPIRTDVDIIIEGKVIENDEKSAKVLTTISSPNGVILAKAKSNWLIPSYSTIAKILGVEEEVLETEMNQFIAPVQEFLKNI
ncbi:MAG: PaaI family thioesterase [Candidatus Hodarchaeota archaeon]